MLGSVCLEESVGIEPFHPIFCSVWLKNVGMDSSPKEEYSLKIWNELVPKRRADDETSVSLPPSLQTLPCYFILQNLQMKVHYYKNEGNTFISVPGSKSSIFSTRGIQVAL